MGMIFVSTLGALAAWILVKIYGERRAMDIWPRVIGGVIGAFIGAWFVGSAFQRKPFLASSPDPVTLLGAFLGGLLGAYLISQLDRLRS